MQGFVVGEGGFLTLMLGREGPSEGTVLELAHAPDYGGSVHCLCTVPPGPRVCEVGMLSISHLLASFGRDTRNRRSTLRVAYTFVSKAR